MISVELPFGIDRENGTWTTGYEKRYDSAIGFSHPDNKANLIATGFSPCSTPPESLPTGTELRNGFG